MLSLSMVGGLMMKYMSKQSHRTNYLTSAMCPYMTRYQWKFDLTTYEKTRVLCFQFTFFPCNKNIFKH